jgi:hypothetical protein
MNKPLFYVDLCPFYLLSFGLILDLTDPGNTEFSFSEFVIDLFCFYHYLLQYRFKNDLFLHFLFLELYFDY